MHTAWWKRYPKVPGAERFVPYYVHLEIIRKEDRVTIQPVYTFIDNPAESARLGRPFQNRLQTGTTETVEPGFICRYRGKEKWIAANSIFARHPHGCDPVANHSS